MLGVRKEARDLHLQSLARWDHGVPPPPPALPLQRAGWKGWGDEFPRRVAAFSVSCEVSVGAPGRHGSVRAVDPSQAHNASFTSERKWVPGPLKANKLNKTATGDEKKELAV